MIPRPFFPGPLFGWAFYLVLVGLLAVAAYIDLRRLVIPKWLTLTALALGLLFNLVRGACLGAGDEGTGVWLFGLHGPVVGALDGLLYGLAGFGIGFGVFLLLWVLGTCGGGDVKLVAALGAWIGPTLTAPVLAGTVILVIVFSVLRLFWGASTRGFSATRRAYNLQEAPRTSKKQDGGHLNARRPRKRLMSYSLPVAVSVACVLLWVFRVELRLPVPGPAAAKTQARVQPW